MSIPIPHKQALSLHLNWTRCEGNVWCKLNSVNLEHAHFNNKPCGVYIIWHGGNKPRAVYVGQGDIKERIAEHRRKQEIQKYEHLGLYVTWASYFKSTAMVWKRILLIFGRPKSVTTILKFLA